MIRAFNRRQRLVAVWLVVTGIAGYLLAWGFFHFVAWRLLVMLPPDRLDWLQTVIPALALGVVTISGWRRHRSGAGDADLADAVMWKGDAESAGAFVAQYRVNQVSSVAWGLSQVFMAGPLRLLEALDRLRSCLPIGTDLEPRMNLLLRELRSRNQWVAVEPFKDHWEAMSALIRTGHVEFSSIKGRVRASS